MSAFAQLNTYSHYIGHRDRKGQSGLAHDDGALSFILNVQGLNDGMVYPDEQMRFLSNYLQFLSAYARSKWQHVLNIDVTAHRKQSGQPLDAYIKENEKLKRGKRICGYYRDVYARHLAQFTYQNEIYLTVTAVPMRKITKTGKILSEHVEGRIRIEEFLNEVRDILPKSVVLTSDKANDAIYSVLNNGQPLRQWDPLNYTINEYLYLGGKPIYDEKANAMRYGKGYQKIYLLRDYPEDSLPLSSELLSLPMDLSLYLYIKNTNREIAMKKMAIGAVRNIESEDANSLQAVNIAKYKDTKEFESYIHENKLDLYNNFYCLRLYARTKEEIQDNAIYIERYLQDNGLEHKREEYIQTYFFYYALPGQGRLAQFKKRIDHSHTVAQLLPVYATPNPGVQQNQLARINQRGEIITYEYDKGGVNNTFTIGRIGSGKGGEGALRVLETYGFGIDTYIIENGKTYQWLVEALGGNYISLEVGQDIINPLPDYDAVKQASEEQKISTISSLSHTLSFILVEKIDLNQAEVAVVETTFKHLYENYEDNKKKPTFKDLYACIKELPKRSKLNENEKKVAKVIMHNIDSFNKSQIGKKISEQKTIDITSNICGIDFKPLIESKNGMLITFYLTFLLLNFMQKIQKKGSIAFLRIDELHAFTQQKHSGKIETKDIIANAILWISRMGRKEGASVDLITQAPEDLNVATGVKEQMHFKNLLYLNEGYDIVEEAFPQIPKKAMALWKGYQNPNELKYRQQILSIGDKAHDIVLSFPRELLLLISTNPLVLRYKEEIGKTTTDHFERIETLEKKVKGKKL